MSAGIEEKPTLSLFLPCPILNSLWGREMNRDDDMVYILKLCFCKIKDLKLIELFLHEILSEVLNDGSMDLGHT